MTNENDRKNLIQFFYDNVNLILSKSTEELIRQEDLGKELSFRPAEETFNEIIKLVKELKNCEVSKVPFNKLESINSNINEFRMLIGKIFEFKPNQPSGYSRENILDQAENILRAMYADIVPYLNYLKKDESDLETKFKRVDEILKSTEYMQNEILNKKTATFNEADQILKNLKEVASESGVEHHSSVFAIEAGENKKKANHWLIATVILGVISILIAYIFLKIIPDSENPSNYVIVHFALTKIIVFSILYYLLVQFIKNYNAQRHNYVVNKHRQNALTTFSTFISSTKDSDTKNAVLLQTTHSIFSAQTSGYLKNESEPDPSQKLIEIVRAGSSTLNNK